MPDRTEAATRVLRQFRLVFGGVKTHFAALEKRAGVGGAMVWALSVIRERPGLSVNALAQAMDVRQPTASNLIKALVAQQFTEVRRNQSDRRAVHLHLLPAGEVVLQRTAGPFAGALNQSLARLDDETLSRLEQDLGVLIHTLHQSAAAIGPAPADKPQR